MSAKYSVIQYVHDSIADERVNVGVAVFTESGTIVRWPATFKRMSLLGGRAEISFVREALRNLERAGRGQASLGGEPGFDETMAERMADEWNGALRISKPRPTTLESGHLLQTLLPRLFGDAPVRQEGRRTRRVAAGLLLRVSEGLTTTLPREAAGHIRHEQPVIGKAGTYFPTVSVANGTPRLCVFPLSLETHDHETALHRMRSDAWAVRDIREHHEVDVQAAFFALLDTSTEDVVDEARRVAEQAGAQLFGESDRDRLADAIARAAS